MRKTLKSVYVYIYIYGKPLHANPLLKTINKCDYISKHFMPIYICILRLVLRLQ